MKIKSEKSLTFYFYLCFLTTGTTFFIFLFSKIILYSKTVPYEVYVVPVSILVFLIPITLYFFRKSKTIIINKDLIEINYHFGKNYSLNSIIGYFETSHKDKFGEYFIFYIKTESKIFKFGSREFKNYEVLTNSIIRNHEKTDVNIYFELKSFLLQILLTLIMLIIIIRLIN